MDIMRTLTDKLVELAIAHDDINEFIDAVHDTVILPGFDEALFVRLYRNANPSAQKFAVRLLRQQEQPSSFQEMRR